MLTKRHLSTLLLSVALFAPLGLRADDDDDHHRDKHNKNWYYDRDGRDWHNWNSREDQAYREYLREQKRQDHDWAKANRKEQQEYWKWRHKHPDSAFGGQGYRDRDDRH